MRDYRFLALWLLLLSACASGPKPNTLATLGRLEVPIDVNAPIDSARDKAMASYWEFMNSAPQDNLRIEALRRLADLELERSEETFQNQLEKLNQQDTPVSLADETKLKGMSYEKAIKLYEDAVAAAESSGKGMDPNVLYQLSKAYEETGNINKSLDTLNKLLTFYPQLENRDEVHFRRGELLFGLEQFRLADLAYTQAMVVSPSSPYYVRALSKRGWTAYKQAEYQKALYSFFTVLNRHFRTEDGGLKETGLSAGDQSFLEDTLRAIVLSFNELGGAPAVSGYFKQNGQVPFADRIYLAVGENYLKQSRVSDARLAFVQFAADYPTNPKAPLFELKGIEALVAGGFGAALVDDKVAFSKKYTVDGEFWKQLNEPAKVQLLPILAKNVEEVARHYHAIAQKSKAPEDYLQAQLWYQQYLRQFANVDAARNINFLLAEVMFENKQYEAAAKEYEKTAYSYVNSGKDLNAGTDPESGYAALLAYDKHALTLADKGSDKEKEAWERLASDSALRFGKTFPEDKRAPVVVIKAAQDLFAAKNYDQAAVAARVVLGLQAKIEPDMRRTAWLIVAKSEFEKSEFTLAEAAYKNAQGLSSDPVQLKDITNGIAASIYKRGEQLRAKGDFKGAGEEFKRVALVAPDSEINLVAKFDLASTLLVEKKWDEAIVALKSYRQENPDSQYQKEIAQNLAIAYDKTNQPLLAAEELDYLMRHEPTISRKRDMAWQIAEIYEKAGSQRKMLDSYLYYVGTFPDPVELAVEARHKLADIYKETGEQERYLHWLNEIIRVDREAEGQRTERTRFLAANASYILAEPKLQQFRDIQLKAPLKTNLSLKKKHMQAAVDAYTEAANYGIAGVTTAAYFWLGEIYKNFSEELMASERPVGMSDEELEQYVILLEEQAYPFEEKSITLHESNAERIRDGVYDEWVQKSFVILKKMRPVRYAKAERSEIIAGIVQ